MNRLANLGYWVRTASAGLGDATRAAGLLPRYGFDDLDLTRIEIVMSVENVPSRRVAEKLGAHHEGIMRERLLLRGGHDDTHLFSLVASETD